MKYQSTMDGGLRIQAEDDRDWALLACIIADVQNTTEDLASRLTHWVDAEDEWEELITPELRGHFIGQLTIVARALDQAQEADEQGLRTIHIPPAEAEAWYGSLNQARLALEERHSLSRTRLQKQKPLSLSKRLAHMRDSMYSGLQYVIFSKVMHPSSDPGQ